MRKKTKAVERHFAKSMGNALIDFAETGNKTRLKRRMNIYRINFKELKL